MIKLSPEKYISFGYNPNYQMILSGWDYKINYFIGIPYVIYTKKLIK